MYVSKIMTEEVTQSAIDAKGLESLEKTSWLKKKNY